MGQETVLTFDEAWAKSQTFCKKILQNKRELAWLFSRLQGKTSYLEIGSANGQSLYVLSFALVPGSTIVYVDKKEIHSFAFESISERHNLIPVIGDSAEMANEVAAHSPYDACFIDGDHNLEPAMRDWELYSPLANETYIHDVIHKTPGSYNVFRRAGGLLFLDKGNLPKSEADKGRQQLGIALVNKYEE